jgi:hypothetical protein
VPLPKRIPWIAIAISLAVLLSSGFAASPIYDVESLTDVAEATFVRPAGYIVLAPVSAVLDTLTLLSAKQHIALVAGALVLFVAFRVWRAVRRSSTLRGHLKATVYFLATILIVYSGAAALPRPMARLEAADAHILFADFHSHTSASHDGRGGFNAERNRDWHRSGGFNVAFITDHASVAQAERGIANNPNPAASGVTLLQGIEVTWTGEHVVIIGAERVYRGLLTADNRDVDEQGLRLLSVIPGREPVVIWNHPRQLDRLPIASGPRSAGVRAIEVVVGAPDNMDDIRPHERDIVRMAEQRNLALTAGSDNHGYGRAAPGWTMMRIFGWRAMAGDSLGFLIEKAIREAGFSATRVVKRRTANPGNSPLLLAATIVTVPTRMLTTLSVEERVMWLLWIWIVVAALWLRRARAAAEPT